MSDKVIPLNLGFSAGFVLQGESTVLVDTGMNVSEEKYKEIFEQVGIKPENIQLIIITHGHSDHFTHLNFLKQLTGAKVLCHKNAARYIETGTNSKVIPRKFIAKILKVMFQGKLKNYKPVTPDIIIENNYNLKDYGINGTIFITPGHTDCSISVVLDSGEAIIGDMLVGSAFSPQKPDLAMFAVDEKELIKSINTILDTGAKVFYGSHGGPFKRESIEKLMQKF